uniref:Predicted protein n=1 Tax=Hordeum vulgare subsp. vulgare TaxID=112509 RepID=F2CY44_HORVV|nr:predicted protein [Hordeum vulgare subsp. vulgare]
MASGAESSSSSSSPCFLPPSSSSSCSMDSICDYLYLRSEEAEY